jgi:hypothetical protein
MSVARATEWMNRVRAAGITVHEAPGWQTRGNGQTSAYEGWLNHHTATGFANSNLGILINGRPDLSGPLCNSCGWEDGSVGLISANPANHAGASGGWDTAPLPVTGTFNKRVWGHEIIYPGTEPMTPEQYHTALVVSKIGVDIWGSGDVNRIKFHEGTSITGKWDPGFAPGQTYSISQFRANVRGLSNPAPVPAKGSDDVAQIFSYDACPKDENSVTATRHHTFVLPVGSVSQVTKAAWLSFKCMDSPGKAERVRLMSVRSGPNAATRYPADQVFTDVDSDVERVYITAGDGSDQFVAYVQCDRPYSLCIEIDPK